MALFAAPGQVSAELTTSMDLFTTLVELAGGSEPSDRPIDGKNIMDVLAGRAGSPHEYFYYFQGPRLEAIRDREWKLRVRRGDRGLAFVQGTRRTIDSSGR